jgi:hypothetical protein
MLRKLNGCLMAKTHFARLFNMLMITKNLVDNLKMMHWVFCHNNSINSFNPRTQTTKNLISYYKTSSIKFSKNVWIKTIPLL